MPVEKLMARHKTPKTPTPKQGLVSLDSDQLKLVAATIANYEKGLRLYGINTYDGIFTQILENTDTSESGFDSDLEHVWLMPKIAEKIQERFDALHELDAQLKRISAEIEAKKLELHERIGLLILQGHDHIL
jgi:D-serine deaminase-like pyridoxal phosphate-dependent protein